MLEGIYQWIENIAFYLVVMTAVLHMLPGESYKKYIRFFVGMILILLVSSPILKIMNMSDFPLEEYEKFIDELEGVVED